MDAQRKQQQRSKTMMSVNRFIDSNRDNFDKYKALVMRLKVLQTAGVYCGLSQWDRLKETPYE